MALKNVLGLSFGYHDSGAAILVDGVPVFFASEERFSGRKNDNAYPRGAIAAALSHAGLDRRDLDAVVYYEDPLLKMDRIAAMAHRFHDQPETYLDDLASNAWSGAERHDPPGYIAASLGVPRDRVHVVEHHHSHAALAYFLSPFERATVVTIDGVGEYETLTVHAAEGNRLTKRRSMTMPNSVGLLYSAITRFCGFEMNEGEYKLMGLAAFGSPRWTDAFAEWIDLDLDALRCFTPDLPWAAPTTDPFPAPFRARFGEPFDPKVDKAHDGRFADMAASVQLALETEVLRLVRAAIEDVGSSNLCLGGGVALNCNANGRIRREVTRSLFVPPAPGDAGSAMGAALAFLYADPRHDGNERRLIPYTPYLGEPLDDVSFARKLKVLGPYASVEEIHEDALADRVADDLVAGNVIGWMQGRFEMGPRALGNRSILADPRTLEMKDIVNRRIKHREPFRPFAPAVLAGHEHELFDMPSVAGLEGRSPEAFMLATHPARAEGRERLQAVTHVDGTSRVQVVEREANPRYHDLISAFADRTGVPVLLNTSLNVSGQPMASDGWTGLYTFAHSELDALVLGNKIIRKKRIAT